MQHVLGRKPSLLTSFSLLGAFINEGIAVVFALRLEHQLELYALQFDPHVVEVFLTMDKDNDKWKLSSQRAH